MRLVTGWQRQQESLCRSWITWGSVQRSSRCCWVRVDCGTSPSPSSSPSWRREPIPRWYDPGVDGLRSGRSVRVVPLLETPTSSLLLHFETTLHLGLHFLDSDLPVHPLLCFPPPSLSQSGAAGAEACCLKVLWATMRLLAQCRTQEQPWRMLRVMSGAPERS